MSFLAYRLVISMTCSCDMRPIQTNISCPFLRPNNSSVLNLAKDRFAAFKNSQAFFSACFKFHVLFVTFRNFVAACLSDFSDFYFSLSVMKKKSELNCFHPHETFAFCKGNISLTDKETCPLCMPHVTEAFLSNYKLLFGQKLSESNSLIPFCYLRAKNRFLFPILYS